MTTPGTWDVHALEFYDEHGKLRRNGRAIDSDNVQNQGYFGYEAKNVFEPETTLFWGGRADRDGHLWLGMDFGSSVAIRKLRFVQKQGGASTVAVEGSNDGREWTKIGVFDASVRNEEFQGCDVATLRQCSQTRSTDQEAFLDYLRQNAVLHVGVVKKLLNKQTAQAKGDDGLTALHLAALAGQETSVSGLVDIFKAFSAFVSLESVDDKGRTAFVLAASKCREKSVMALLILQVGERRLQQLVRHDTDGFLFQTMPATQIAAYLKKRARGIVGERLSAAINKPNPSDWGYNALHRAAYFGDAESVEWLIDHGGDVNHPTIQSGATPLHMSLMNASTDVTELLISRGANVTLPNYMLETPLERLLKEKSCNSGPSRQIAKVYMSTMCDWQKVKALVNLKNLEKTSRDLLRLAFGSDSLTNNDVFGFTAENRKIIKIRDQLQARHQLLIAHGDADRRKSILGGLVAALVGLAGNERLEGPCRTLCTYLLVNGCCNSDVIRAAEKSLRCLEDKSHRCYAKLKSLPTLTSTPVINKHGGRAPHQRLVHKKLSWLTDMNTVEAAVALFENGSFGSIEDFCLWADSLSPDSIASDYILSVYRKWLLGEAALVDDVFQKRISDVLPSFASVRAGPLKKDNRVKVKQVNYSSVGCSLENGELSYEEAVSILEDRCLQNLEDRMCAGGLLDFCRASVVCDTEDQLVECYKILTEQADFFNVARIKNGFHKDAETSYGYRDIKLCAHVATPDNHDMIVEVQLILTPLLNLKKFQHEAYNIVRGDYTTG